jgi:hypothetical protein
MQIKYLLKKKIWRQIQDEKNPPYISRTIRDLCGVLSGEIKIKEKNDIS